MQYKQTPNIDALVIFMLKEKIKVMGFLQPHWTCECLLHIWFSASCVPCMYSIIVEYHIQNKVLNTKICIAIACLLIDIQVNYVFIYISIKLITLQNHI